MTIVHREKSDEYKYTKVPNEIINSKELSSDAIVVAIWLASKRKDWNIVKAAIKNHFNFSKERVNKIFDQLIEAKHLSVSEEKGKDGRYKARVYAFYVNPEMNTHPYEKKESQKSKSAKKGKQVNKSEENCSDSNESVYANSSTEETLPEAPVEEEPSPEKSATEEPCSEKAILTKTDVLINTDQLSNTDQQQEESYADIEVILPKEFNMHEKALLLEEFKKVDKSSAVKVIEEFIYQRSEIKKPVAWVCKMIEKCSKGRFYPTHQKVVARELEQAKQDEGKRKQNEAIQEATKHAQEHKMKEQVKGFEHSGPGSASKLMKGKFNPA